jgi:multimeric flavodoxin WrbA
MNILYISGSPRKNSNTDFLLKLALSITGGEFIKLVDYRIEPCSSCRVCQKLESCMIDDDMKHVIIPKIIKSSCIVIGSPVFLIMYLLRLKLSWIEHGALEENLRIK